MARFVIQFNPVVLYSENTDDKEDNSSLQVSLNVVMDGVGVCLYVCVFMLVVVRVCMSV